MSVASSSGSALSRGTWTGQGSQGTFIKEPPQEDPVNVLNCWLKNLHEIKTLAVKCNKLISGYEQGQEAGLERCALTLLINKVYDFVFLGDKLF